MAYVCPNLWQLDSRKEFDDALENIRAQPQAVRERINSDDRKGLPYYLDMYLEEKNPLLKRRAEPIRMLMEEIAQNRYGSKDAHIPEDARVPETEEASEDETLCGEYEEGDEKLEEARFLNDMKREKNRSQKKKTNKDLLYDIEQKLEADSPTLKVTQIKGEFFNEQISTKFDDDIAHGEHKLATPKPPMPPPPTPPTPPQNVSKAELEDAERRLTEFNEMTECTQFFDSLWKIKEDGTVITKSRSDRSDRDATAERRRVFSVVGFPDQYLIPVHNPNPSPQYTNNTTTQDIVDEGNTRAIKTLKDIKAGNVKCPVITD